MNFVTSILLTLIATSLALLNSENKMVKCKEQRSYGMIGYFCNYLKLEEVPKNIKSSIEILDLAYNYLWRLDSESFAACPDLKFLYLQFNSITNITQGTFTNLKKLEVLDLSKNVLGRVPAVFDLPLLRNLYLERNNFDSHAFESIPNPVIAPLRKINLADNNLNSVPHQLGILPDLFHLNISSNPMAELTPQQFSPFCNLKEVDLNNTQMEKCRCMEVMDFLTINRNFSIISSLLFCKTKIEDCQRTQLFFNETEDFTSCVISTQQLIAERKSKMTLGTAGLLGFIFLILFIGCLFCVHQSNVKKNYNSNIVHNPQRESAV